MGVETFGMWWDVSTRPDHLAGIKTQGFHESFVSVVAMLVDATDSEAGISGSDSDDGRISRWLELVVYFGMMFSAMFFFGLYLTKHDQTFFNSDSDIIVFPLVQQDNFTTQGLNQSRGLAVALVPRGKRTSKICFLESYVGPANAKSRVSNPIALPAFWLLRLAIFGSACSSGVEGSLSFTN